MVNNCILIQLLDMFYISAVNLVNTNLHKLDDNFYTYIRGNICMKKLYVTRELKKKGMVTRHCKWAVLRTPKSILLILLNSEIDEAASYC